MRRVECRVSFLNPVYDIDAVCMHHELLPVAPVQCNPHIIAVHFPHQTLGTALAYEVQGSLLRLAMRRRASKEME